MVCSSLWRFDFVVVVVAVVVAVVVVVIDVVLFLVFDFCVWYISVFWSSVQGPQGKRKRRHSRKRGHSLLPI